MPDLKPTQDLQNSLDKVASIYTEALAKPAADLLMTETGIITFVGGGIARVKGLPDAFSEEVLLFPGNVLGITLNLGVEEIGVILLGDDPKIKAGEVVRRTGHVADTPVGDALLGRVVDATGKVLDGGSQLNIHTRMPMEREAPAIMDRAPVKVPLQTGIKSIDALIPIGRGQRELIVGDRQTGKTSVAIDTIINQRGTEMICIYCAIGQRGTAVARVVETFREAKMLEQTIVVVTSGEDQPGLQYMTPYAATTMAEWFRDQGKPVLIVYDDLIRHARAYRELSLLLRRAPGREAFPGDIFYIHSRLLERSTQLSVALGGGSMTALPIIETQAEDISAYIPTNLVSITDGQIYLSPGLFRKGLLPAVDTGRSVSRVGGKAQLPAYREVAGDLRLSYSQFEELEAFARFASRLDDESQAAITRGKRVREVLKQAEHKPLTVIQQIAMLKAVNEGLFDQVELDQLAKTQQKIATALDTQMKPLATKVDAGKKLSDADWQSLMDFLIGVIKG
ncbi:alternate F1F0 ATPase, F1 subunit alpha [Leucothrix arctica]|uniref:ATP synthase subunit alpha n=1 Tax=Leucothrix arctica TaxID=1481894 RepID=A0A317C6B9_9GAMM|nr:alternate F1F0 ATPase, F1 subunit alpha [Leucothrix arctica]PWQ93847.1 F0F1 ATP synthase subunit alpha [Leucothrix arctica]